MKVYLVTGNTAGEDEYGIAVDAFGVYSSRDKAELAASTALYEVRRQYEDDDWGGDYRFQILEFELDKYEEQYVNDYIE